MSKLSLHLTKHTGPKHTATVIFFHGSGDNGKNLQEWVNIVAKNFFFPHIKVIFPTAPAQPYTPAGGQLSNVWFDRAAISPKVPEMLESISKIETMVKNLLKEENDAGIPSSRIVVGGFSMGGTLSFHTAYRWDRTVAGAVVCSSFLNDNSIVYEALANADKDQLPPLLQLHGEKDTLVPPQWGQETFSQLTRLGVQGDFQIMSKLDHAIDRRGMHLVRDWIQKRLPDNV